MKIQGTSETGHHLVEKHLTLEGEGTWETGSALGDFQFPINRGGIIIRSDLGGATSPFTDLGTHYKKRSEQINK